jgi:hypothetical protein
VGNNSQSVKPSGHKPGPQPPDEIPKPATKMLQRSSHCELLKGLTSRSCLEIPRMAPNTISLRAGKVKRPKCFVLNVHYQNVNPIASRAPTGQSRKWDSHRPPATKTHRLRMEDESMREVMRCRVMSLGRHPLREWCSVPAQG